MVEFILFRVAVREKRYDFRIFAVNGQAGCRIFIFCVIADLDGYRNYHDFGFEMQSDFQTNKNC